MKISSEGDVWLSPAQAARRVGVTSQWVRQLAARGLIKAIPTPLGLLFDKQSVEQFSIDREVHSPVNSIQQRPQNLTRRETQAVSRLRPRSGRHGKK